MNFPILTRWSPLDSHANPFELSTKKGFKLLDLKSALNNSGVESLVDFWLKKKSQRKQQQSQSWFAVFSGCLRLNISPLGLDPSIRVLSPTKQKTMLGERDSKGMKECNGRSRSSLKRIHPARFLLPQHQRNGFHDDNKLKFILRKISLVILIFQMLYLTILVMILSLIRAHSVEQWVRFVFLLGAPSRWCAELLKIFHSSFSPIFLFSTASLWQWREERMSGKVFQTCQTFVLSRRQRADFSQLFNSFLDFSWSSSSSRVRAWLHSAFM